MSARDETPGVAKLVEIQARRHEEKRASPAEEPSFKTDRANADRFIDQNGDRVRWCPHRGEWLLWTGRRWKAGTEEVTALAHETIRRIYAEAAAEPDLHRRGALARWAASSERGQRVRYLLDFSKPYLLVDAAELDADLFVLNVENGTLDLRTCRLRPHSADDLITKMCPVTYRPRARSKTWDRFLMEQLPDSEIREFLQLLAGYLLTGDVGEEVVVFLHGPGRTGKTKFVEAIAHVLGDYAAPVPAELIAVDPRGHLSSVDHYALAGLQGLRLAHTSETEDGKRLNSARLKTLSGGDTVHGRFPYGRFFSFRPTHTLIFVSNYKPRIDADDTATFERLVVLPFERVVPEDQRDIRLGEKLRAAAPAILAWAVRGLRRYNRRGRLRPLPKPVRIAVAEYQSEMDVLSEFLSEQTDRDPTKTAVVPFSAVWEAWNSWCRSSGNQPHSKTWLAKKLEDLGFPAEKGTGGQRMRRGLILRPQGGSGGRYDPHVDNIHREQSRGKGVEIDAEHATPATREKDDVLSF